MTPPPRVTLFSYHYLGSKRRAGFHWIADACRRLGWDVVFVTAPISHLSRLRGDFRLEYPVRAEANRLVPAGERMSSYVLFTRVHPVSSGHDRIDRLTGPLMARYGRVPLGALAEVVRGSRVLIVESTPALLLVPRLRELAPTARVVYRASDDLTFSVLRAHPVVVDAERTLVESGAFDLVSAAAHLTVDRLGHGARYEPHGVAKHLFDAARESPYGPGPNVVWVGTRWREDAFLGQAAEELPDWRFHIIGPVPRTIRAANVHYHGELPYEETVPYLRHADVGLATFPPFDAADRGPDLARIHSLKTAQYTYCGLPIVAPSDLVIDRAHVYAYDPADRGSIRRALEAAAAAGRHPELGRDVPSWDDLARELLDIDR
jgi:2-beta-glucuronyltransferase